MYGRQTDIAVSHCLFGHCQIPVDRCRSVNQQTNTDQSEERLIQIASRIETRVTNN